MRQLGKRVRAVLVPEMNLGQMILEVERHVNDDVLLRGGINRIGGVPLTVEEILREIRGGVA